MVKRRYETQLLSACAEMVQNAAIHHLTIALSEFTHSTWHFYLSSYTRTFEDFECVARGHYGGCCAAAQMLKAQSTLLFYKTH